MRGRWRRWGCGVALNGDMTSGLAPLTVMYRTTVHALAGWRNRRTARIGFGPGAMVIPQQPSTRTQATKRGDAILRALVEHDISVDQLASHGFGR